MHLRRADLAVLVGWHHKMSRAVEQTNRVRHRFMQNGDARVVEELWNDEAFKQPRMSPYDGAADQPMRDDHQSTVYAPAPADDEVEGSCDTRVKCRPVFAIGRHEVRSERIFRQLSIRRTAQIAEVALL